MANAGNEKVVQVQERHRREDEKALRAGIDYLLEDQRGQDFLWWLLEQGYLFKTTYTGNAAGNFNEGMRSLALKIYGRVTEHNPESYLRMQLRKHKQAQGRAQELSNAERGNDDE